MIDNDLSIDTISIPKGGTLYFIGIGGIGMSALARVFHHYGYTVKGSDKYDSSIIQELRAEGIDVRIGHAHKPRDVDVAVYSSAIDRSNEEFSWFKHQKVPFIHRGMLLASVMNKRRSVAVTGTHGKTTTSSFIAFLAKECALDPTALVGGYINNYDSNVLLGSDDLIIAEVDESDKSQLYYSPEINVVTNLEADHLDSYKDIHGVCNAFEKYFANLKKNAVVIYCADDSILTDLVTKTPLQQISYGLSDGCAYRAKNIVIHDDETSFELYKEGRFISEIVIPLMGEHNVVNTLAACAVLDLLGVDSMHVIAAMRSFQGVKRRMEILYDDQEVMVIDDYAHHPTEIQTVLESLKNKGRRIVVIFQPHRYTRTLHLMEDFKHAFHAADSLILTTIYSAGESPIEGISIHTLAREVQTVYSKPCNVVALPEIEDHLIGKVSRGDILVFLGAGDITDVAHRFAKKINCATLGVSPQTTGV